MKSFKGIVPKCKLCGGKFDPIFKPNTPQVQDYTIKQPSFTDIHVGWDYTNHKCNEKGLEKNKIKLQADRIKQQKQATQSSNMGNRTSRASSPSSSGGEESGLFLTKDLQGEICYAAAKRHTA